MGGVRIEHGKIAVRRQGPDCAVGGIFIIGGVLIAEPEGQPGTIGALLAFEIDQAAALGLCVEAFGIGILRLQHVQRAEVVGRQIGSAAVEGERTETAAERRPAAIAMGCIWLIMALFELPFHLTHSLAPAKTRTMTVIGDSVTAGVDGDETSETWPSLFARQHQIEVQDISHIGETAASALKRARTQSIESAVVVVEIGGNDILGSTTTADFARDLEALLAFLESPDRQVIMFELPLPPFCHEFGRIQRTAAAKHNVTLIPKRVFLSVIAGSESTLDTIHLSQSGHQFMADTVWQSTKSAFPTELLIDE